MAIKLENKTNAIPPTSKHPYGLIRDKDANNAGTPVNQNVYQDHHTFFQKLMDEAGLTFSGVLDNADDGFDFWEAFEKLLFPYQGTDVNIDGQALPTGNEINLSGRHQVYKVNDPDSEGLLQRITSSDHENFDYVILIFNDQVDIGSGGNLDIGGSSNISVFTGLPYVFRKNDTGNWTLESAFFHLNQKIEDEIDNLDNKTADKQQEPYQDVNNTVGFSGNWSDSGVNIVSYMRDEMGFVHLKGQLENSGSPGSPDTAFVLPSGYRPVQELNIAVAQARNNAEVNVIEIRTTGDVRVWFGSDMITSLDGITFRAQ